jgi:hypothetical protein
MMGETNAADSREDCTRMRNISLSVEAARNGGT